MEKNTLQLLILKFEVLSFQLSLEKQLLFLLHCEIRALATWKLFCKLLHINQERGVINAWKKFLLNSATSNNFEFAKLGVIIEQCYRQNDIIIYLKLFIILCLSCEFPDYCPCPQCFSTW